MGTINSHCVWLAALVAAGLAMSQPVQAMQCVPFARDASGIEIKGDAWRWWNEAAGAYERGHEPRPGAVLVFRKHGRMRLGHVAVVRQLIDSRTMLIDHANWGPHRGAVAQRVPLRDVSAHNDWSEVRVWNAITRDFGTQTYPTYGFIYPHARHHGEVANGSVAVPEVVIADLMVHAEPQSAPGDSGPAFTLLAAEADPIPAQPVAAVTAVPLPTPEEIVAPSAQPWWNVSESVLHSGSGRFGTKAADE